jgi:hypothetical protein
VVFADYMVNSTNTARMCGLALYIFLINL